MFVEDLRWIHKLYVKLYRNSVKIKDGRGLPMHAQILKLNIVKIIGIFTIFLFKIFFKIYQKFSGTSWIDPQTSCEISWQFVQKGVL